MKNTDQQTSYERVIKKTQPSEADRDMLAGIDVDMEQQANDFFDYSKVVVRKPWGYEYLLYQNDIVSVWILYIKKGYQTSMHCHPNKKTSIVLLSGKALCSTVEGEVIRAPGEGILLGEGAFHRTRSLSEEETFVMEVETPVNKRDLVRAKDDYGREKLGYEGKEHMSLNLHNYNYISFIDSNIYYNAKQRFGDCSIELKEFTNIEALLDDNGLPQWDTLTILRGKVLNDQDETIFDVGDTFGREDIELHSNLRITNQFEAIIIKKTDTMVRLSDFVVSHLKKRDVKDFFFVPETTNAHLTDAIGRDTEVRSLSLNTEHAATLAAESHAKLTGKPCVAIISSGSSAINALVGVANAWVDSTPLIVIAAQSRSSELEAPGSQPIRQLANKEIDIVNIVQPITKYATVIQDPLTVKEELDRALSLSTTGRYGPVWIDIPIDVLGTNINETELSSFESKQLPDREGPHKLKEKVLQTLALLKDSRRPVFLAGHGIRAARAQSGFVELIKSLSIPVLTSRRGVDLIPEDFPLYFGRPGTYGHRAANFIIQNADLLICVGARLSLPLIGRNYKAFARAAKKVIVDIDAQELEKVTIRPDVAINADAGKFIQEMIRCMPQVSNLRYREWTEQCQLWRSRFPPNRESREIGEQGNNPYYFVEILSNALEENDIVVVDGGPSLDYVMQAFRVKTRQRIISSPGLEHQGFALPGAIGACLSHRQQRIVCLCERKGLQANIVELQTIVNNRLPVKTFAFNSKGSPSVSVQQTQATYFGGRYIGSVSDSVSASLDIAKLGKANRIPTDVVTENSDAQNKIERLLAAEGPTLCEITLPKDHEIIPRIVLTVSQDGKWISRPLEDMYPFLDRKELEENMIIDVLDKDKKRWKDSA